MKTIILIMKKKDKSTQVFQTKILKHARVQYLLTFKTQGLVG